MSSGGSRENRTPAFRLAACCLPCCALPQSKTEAGACRRAIKTAIFAARKMRGLLPSLPEMKIASCSFPLSARIGSFDSEPVELHAQIDGAGMTTASGVFRWLSKDPVEELGGLNQYAFVQNEPVRRTDPLGLTWGLGNPVCGPGGCAGPSSPYLPNPWSPGQFVWQPGNFPNPRIGSCLITLISVAINMAGGASGPQAHCEAACQVANTCGASLSNLLGQGLEFVQLWIAQVVSWSGRSLSVPHGIIQDSAMDLLHNQLGRSCAGSSLGCKCCCQASLGSP